MKSLAHCQMSVLLSDLFSEEEKKLLVIKLAHPERMCKSAGCFEPRKPKYEGYPQSRYCARHAKIAKANAIEMGRQPR